MAENSMSDLDPEQLRQLLSIVEEPELRSPVEQDRSSTQSSVVDKTDQKLGSWIDHYKLINCLGEGGMGAVYLAEQEHPVQRQVALKVIKLGMDSKRIIARFEAERQALALLNHPNIAQIFDAGTTDDGRPYFVMEYVAGKPVTQFCDDNKLSIDKRLGLLAQVCQAIHHAHQRGIIHRDIKPSNVLVTNEEGRMIPKVIDFGVARATNPQLANNTFFTEEGQLIGTPEYMSAEQVNLADQDIDIRSDVYSLGALLYVVLTGVLPFDAERLRKGGIETVRRLIIEEDPKTPSTRLAGMAEKANEIADNRGTQIKSLTKRLHNELEWIPLKAMSKESEQRYRSAAQLGDDIRNYLAGTPLTAGPPSTFYRAKKFVKRNRVIPC